MNLVVCTLVFIIFRFLPFISSIDGWNINKQQLLLVSCNMMFDQVDVRTELQ